LFKNLFFNHAKGSKEGLYNQTKQNSVAQKITPTVAGVIIEEKRGR
jgi:hypothetical protein